MSESSSCLFCSSFLEDSSDVGWLLSSGVTWLSLGLSISENSWSKDSNDWATPPALPLFSSPSWYGL